MINPLNYLTDEVVSILDTISIEELTSLLPDDKSRRAAYLLYLKGYAQAMGKNSERLHDVNFPVNNL